MSVGVGDRIGLEPSATEGGPSADRTRIRVRDVAFFTFFPLYALAALALLALGIGALVASASPAFHDSLHLRALSTGPAGRVASRMADASHNEVTAWQVAIDYSISVLNFGLAIFLVWLRPRDRAARLLAIGLVGTAAIFNLQAQAAYEAVIGGPTPAEEFWHSAFQIVAGLAYLYAMLVFPDGKPVPRWHPVLVAPIYALATAGAVVLTLRAEGTARPATLIVFFGLFVPIAGLISQGYRFERSESAAAHQQARLLFWSLLPALGIGLFFVATQGLGSISSTTLSGRGLSDLPETVFRLFQPVFALIPVVLFLALLRYRLWDIDRVINRTLVYGSVTAVLAGSYFGIVVLLQRLFRPFTGGSDLAIAGSTLLVAAAFGPARRRMQSFVDRRFYRHRYDAARTIEAFATRLRDEVDLDALTAELRGVVAEAMQPEQVSLWLREPNGSLCWAWTHRPTGRRNGGAP